MSIIIVAVTSAVIAVACGAACGVLVIKSRRSDRRTARLITELGNELIEANRNYDGLLQRTDAQARRVAWLETRLHLTGTENWTGAAAAAEGVVKGSRRSDRVGAAAPAYAKPSMTERRHRVLTLAKRGLDSGEIATTLGVPYGEVELIVGLSNAAEGC